MKFCKKSLLPLCIAFCLAAGTGACGGTSTKETAAATQGSQSAKLTSDTESAVSQPTGTASTTSAAPAETTPGAQAKNEPVFAQIANIPSAVIMDNEYAKVEFVGIDKDYNGCPLLKFSATNRSDEIQEMIALSDISINGIAVPTHCNATPKAGETVEFLMELDSYFELRNNRYGIKEVLTIDFYIDVTDYAFFGADPLVSSDPIRLATVNFKGSLPKPEEIGTVLINTPECTVVYLTTETGYNIEAHFVVYNHSDEVIRLFLDSEKIKDQSIGVDYHLNEMFEARTIQHISIASGAKEEDLKKMGLIKTDPATGREVYLLSGLTMQLAVTNDDGSKFISPPKEYLLIP